jgi:hypothetical protein
MYAMDFPITHETCMYEHHSKKFLNRYENEYFFKKERVFFTNL